MSSAPITLCIVSQLYDWKEQHICMKFVSNSVKTAMEVHEMLKIAFGDNAMGRTQIFQWSYSFKHRETLLGDCEHLGRSSTGHRDKVLRNSAKLLMKTDQHCEEILQPMREQVRQKNILNGGRTRTGWVTKTVRQETLLCHCSNLLSLQTWLWYPTLSTCLIWSFGISCCLNKWNDNCEVVISRCPWNPGIMLTHNSKKSVPALLQQWECWPHCRMSEVDIFAGDNNEQ